MVATNSPPHDYDSKLGKIEQMIVQINESKASVPLVGLDAGRQKKFIVKYRDHFPHVKTFLPLGGTIDYEAGTLVRPTSWITDAGVE